MYHHLSRSRRRRRYFIAACAVAGLGLLIAYFILRHGNGGGPNSQESQGTVTRISEPDDNQKLVVNESTFTMTLLGPWKEVSRNKDARYPSIEWQYIKKFYEARRLTNHADKLPSNLAVN